MVSSGCSLHCVHTKHEVRGWDMGQSQQQQQHRELQSLPELGLLLSLLSGQGSAREEATSRAGGLVWTEWHQRAPCEFREGRAAGREGGGDDEQTQNPDGSSALPDQPSPASRP